MYVKNIKDEFYKVVMGKRLVIIAHHDIDAVCTCHIIQDVLKNDDVLYTLRSIRGLAEMRAVFMENREDTKYFLFVNCGANIDIVEHLQPEEDVVFFILDSHRPTDVCNIYSIEQVRLLGANENDASVPEFGEIFRDDESEDEDSGTEDETEGRASKRLRLGEEQILRRRERRAWEENRNKLMFEYTQFSYYAKASAVVAYVSAFEYGKDKKEFLWFAIVAVTEQMLLGKIESSQYILLVNSLQGYVNRFAHRSDQSNDSTALKITLKNDLHLSLYRHWTVEASLRYSRYSACKLKMWTVRGEKKLHELLVEMGVPLAQARKAFGSMDLQLRQEFAESLEKCSDKYGLKEITFLSYVISWGYRHKYSASDMVYALLTVLEALPESFENGDSFLNCLSCLSRQRTDLFDQAVDKAKALLVTIFKETQAIVEMKKVHLAGPFIYVTVNEASVEAQVLSRPHVLCMFAHYVLNAVNALSRTSRIGNKPLIVTVPCSSLGRCAVLGIPPIKANVAKNFFGKAFEQIAERMNIDVYADYFDTSYCQINATDCTKFIDALTEMLS